MMGPLISNALAEEIAHLSERMNRGYWSKLYWELQEDGAQLLIRVTLDDRQNTDENISIVLWILRVVLATFLPSSPDRITWAAVVVHKDPLNDVASACGGLGEDWRTLGIHSDLGLDRLWGK